MLVADRPLVGSHQPTLEEGDHAVNPRHQLRWSLLLSPSHMAGHLTDARPRDLRRGEAPSRESDEIRRAVRPVGRGTHHMVLTLTGFACRPPIARMPAAMELYSGV
jgi:hypothetical protein